MITTKTNETNQEFDWWFEVKKIMQTFLDQYKRQSYVWYTISYKFKESKDKRFNRNRKPCQFSIKSIPNNILWDQWISLMQTLSFEIIIYVTYVVDNFFFIFCFYSEPINVLIMRLNRGENKIEKFK